MFAIGYLTLIAIIQGVAFIAELQSAELAIAQQHRESMIMTIASEAAAGTVSIIIVTYEYLWFTTIMRWIPTFSDTLIPYSLGVGETVSALLLGNPHQWWLATSVFLVVAAASLLHTVLRMPRALFPEQPNVYRRLRRLGVRLACCCLLGAAWGACVAVLPLAVRVRAYVYVAAPWAVILIGTLIVILTERALTATYANYNILRVPGLPARYKSAHSHCKHADRTYLLDPRRERSS